MLPAILALLFTFPAPTWAAEPPKEGKVYFTKEFLVAIQLKEEKAADNSVVFFRDGKPPQIERGLGDHFLTFAKNGKDAYFQSADLFKDGRQELFVRLSMMPMGVIRVFAWDPEAQTFTRLRFGTKKEDGIPVPLTGPVSLKENGDIAFTGKKKGAKTTKDFLVHWNGSDYELPAKPLP